MLAEACNLGLEPVSRPDRPALNRGRLAWVGENYLRADTLARANCRLVDYQPGIGLARHWGGGEVASADGLRFVVPVHSVHAGPNRRYFGAGRGVTYYNFSSDQFTGFHAIVIPGTLRDSLFILDGLLDNPTSLEPTEVMADTAGYSDVVFGLFRLLGYQFSPRLADAGDARFWRIDPATSYGPLNGIARHRVDIPHITANWDDILRATGLLRHPSGQCSSPAHADAASWSPGIVLGPRRGGGRPPRQDALPARLHRRRGLPAPHLLNQLNGGESRHGLARRIFHGQQGELHQAYREGQEEQLGALGLVLNAIVLWNTRYLDRAVNYLLDQGRTVAIDDIARLSPLVHNHINLHGRYQFTLDGPAAHGQLRPLNSV